MLIDGLKLTDTSVAENLNIASGPTLPATGGNTGELFFQTGVGLHTYTGSLWEKAGGGAAPYDIATSVFGRPAANEVILRMKAGRAFTISSIVATAGVAGTVGSTVFTVLKNGSNIGTITFAVSGTTGTSTVSDVSFAIGDVLTITAPETANATLADIDFFILATLA